MLIMTVASRYARNIRNDGILQDWKMMIVLSNLKGNVHLWHKFRRNYLSSTYKTSATVLLDIRKSRIHRPHRERVICAICPDVTKNRMLCVHETVPCVAWLINVTQEGTVFIVT